MEARTVKHHVAAFFAVALCAAPAGAFAQLAASENGSGQSAHSLQEPSLTRPETWLKSGNPPHGAAVKTDPTIATAPAHAESSGAARIEPGTPPNDTGFAPKPDTALLPHDADNAMHENDDGERSVPRGAREAARDPCLRSSDPKCYERHKDHYHPYLGYMPGATQSATAAVGATSAVTAGGAVGGRIAPASAAVAPSAATPRTLDQPLVFFDPPPRKHRRGR